VVPFVPEVTLLTAAEPFGLWDRTQRDAPPFWAFPWAGGQGLARYVLDHPETVAGRGVLGRRPDHPQAAREQGRVVPAP